MPRFHNGGGGKFVKMLMHLQKAEKAEVACVVLLVVRRTYIDLCRPQTVPAPSCFCYFVLSLKVPEVLYLKVPEIPNSFSDVNS